MTDERRRPRQRFRTADETEREAGIADAALAVQRGQLVVLPTDTVYGIGADAFDADGGAPAARRQGPRPRDAAAGAGLRGRPPSTRSRSASRRTPGR